jgi:hypothetical protein
MRIGDPRSALGSVCDPRAIAASNTGSSAVTAPLAGTMISIELFLSLYTFKYGSRLETTNSGFFCSLFRRLTRKRSAVQIDITLESRNRASSSAVARAAFGHAQDVSPLDAVDQRFRPAAPSVAHAFGRCAVFAAIWPSAPAAR